MSENQAELLKKIGQLPLQPGVYQFFGADGRLLYIGKATSLRARVRSYFRGSTDLSGAKQLMVFQIADIKTTVVDTEPEALLLETTLIKKYKPPFNVVMKDDKNFQFIHITDDLFPQLETVRQLPLRGRTGRYFGPYTSGYAVKQTLRLLKSIFQFCISPPVVKHGQVVYPKRPCLEYQMNRCLGPCAGVISAAEYQKVFDQIERFLKGDYEPVRRYVERQMVAAAAKEQFEKAARFRDQLGAIDRLMTEQKVVSPTRENADYLSLARLNGTAAVNVFTVRRGKMIHQEVFILQHTRDQSDAEILTAFRDQYYAQTMTRPPQVYVSSEERRGRHRKLLEMGITNTAEALKRQTAAFAKRDEEAAGALAELGQAIGLSGQALKRIEVYDISNIQGKFPVASMIVFTDGRPDPAQYRKFKIQTVRQPDDFASMREVINRRVRHLPKRATGRTSPWPRPDLIIVDGGKGQLSAAKAILDAAALKIPLAALAKREEEIFLPGRPESIRLPKGSAGLHLVQRMRDEAHRFAIGFYRRRHLKSLV
jgi:excinuclease ABC subunit C